MDLYRRISQDDALDERTWRPLLKVHAQHGDQQALEREWCRMLDILRAMDPTLRPEAATVALYEQLRIRTT